LLLVQAQGEPRIRLVFHDTNQHISAASNTAIAQARGEYIAFLDHDDELRPHTLLNVVQALQARPEAQVLYSDEDKIDQHGRRFDPYFKPIQSGPATFAQLYVPFQGLPRNADPSARWLAS
jgi:glycosyltransferase involved in cell wall biosynthesis